MSNVIPVYNFNEKTVSASSLDLGWDGSVLQGIDVVDAISVYVRVIRNNMRMFSASTKTRGEVNFSTRKMWKQKGTGRARVGSAACPLWRKGGRIFGPRPGGRTLMINKESSKIAWQSLLDKKIRENSVVGLDLNLDSISKAKQAFNVLVEVCKNEQSACAKRFVFLVHQDELGLLMPFCNLKQVVMETYERADFLNLATADYILFLKKDSESFKNILHRN